MTPPAIVNLGLFVRLEARTGREEEVENFIKSALPVVDGEAGTTVWFGFRMGPSTFGIFDCFPDDSARQEHLNGQVAAQLMEKADDLFAQPPSIEPLDILAAKLPALAAAESSG
jgi:quinol monooxygenase YgiN